MADDLLPDEPVPEPAITPEVVGPRPPGRLRVVRVGLVLLAVSGVFLLYVGASTASDPARARCAAARLDLEDAQDTAVDDAPAGETPTTIDVDALDCEEAVTQALALEDESLVTESTVRTYGFVYLAVGAVQALGAVLTLRRPTKRFRLIALIGAAVGIVASPLGILGVALYGFCVYAVLFSGEARATFGDPGGPRMFRPRI